MNHDVFPDSQVKTFSPRISIHDKRFYLTAVIMLFIYIMAGFSGSQFENLVSGVTGLLHADLFILVYLLLTFLMVCLVLFFPGDLSVGKKSVLILGISILVRCALIPFEPSDDINRYLWEGKLVSEGVNPYFFSPDFFHQSDLAAQDIFYPYINHPENPAAYPPMMLLIFSLPSLTFYSPVMIKMMVMLFDMLTIFVMLLLLQEKKQNLRWVLLYAVNPIILFAFAGQGHFEPVQIFFFGAALLAFMKKKWVWMFLFLGLSFQVKYVAVLTIPFFIARENLKYIWVLIVSALVFYIPFIDGNPYQLFSCLVKFGEEYAFNGSVHKALWLMTGDMKHATFLCKIAFIISFFALLYLFHPARNRRFKGNPAYGSLSVLLALILLSPTVHYWYLTWLFPFFLLIRKKSVMVLFVFACFYFPVFDIQYSSGVWILPGIYMIYEWIPFYLVLFFEVFFLLKGLGLKKEFDESASLSVIIPAYNEAGRVGRCIKTIFMDPAVTEVIVADGGSDDETLKHAAELGAQVVVADQDPEDGGGRGGQILAGLKKATGELIVIVHADTLPAPHTFTRIRNVMNLNLNMSGGSAGSRFDSPGFRYRFLDFLNDLKAGFLNLSFGDQIQFFRRKQMIDNNLFPDIPLMEDVELNLRLSLLGNTTYLFGKSAVSVRRWEKKGMENSVSVIKRVLIYLVSRLFKNPDTVNMYYDYYGRGK